MKKLSTHKERAKTFKIILNRTLKTKPFLFRKPAFKALNTLRVTLYLLPGVSPASHSHPHSRPVRGHAAAVHSSRGLLQPLHCGREE